MNCYVFNCQRMVRKGNGLYIAPPACAERCTSMHMYALPCFSCSQQSLKLWGVLSTAPRGDSMLWSQAAVTVTF